MAGRGGRPARFTPEIGEALIDLVIDDDVPIVHAARRMGLGVRTVYDWLERARGEGAARALAKWADRFTQPSDCAGGPHAVRGCHSGQPARLWRRSPGRVTMRGIEKEPTAR